MKKPEIVNNKQYESNKSNPKHLPKESVKGTTKVSKKNNDIIQKNLQKLRKKLQSVRIPEKTKLHISNKKQSKTKAM